MVSENMHTLFTTNTTLKQLLDNPKTNNKMKKLRNIWNSLWKILKNMFTQAKIKFKLVSIKIKTI